jgi:AcrR family transcriptional regulator
MSKKEPQSHIAIIDSMYELLAEKSFRSITTKEICNRAGVGRSTFYRHFHDKYEILEKENAQIIDGVTHSMNKFLEDGDFESLPYRLLESVDRMRYLSLIDVTDYTVNLRRDLHDAVEKYYLLYFKQKEISQKWNISFSFAKDLFVATVLAFLENSLRADTKDEVDRNIAFSKKIVGMFMKNPVDPSNN